MISLCLIGFVATAIYVHWMLGQKPTYEYHDVKVVKVIDTYTWILSKNDGMFRAEFCHDYDLTPYEPQPGNVMTKFRYEDKGYCLSVQRADLGFWWLRDPNTGKAIKEN